MGGSWENDIEAAAGAGHRTVFVDRFDHRSDRAVPRIRSLAELHLAPAPARTY